MRISDRDEQIRIIGDQLREFGIDDFVYHAALSMNDIDIRGSRENQVRDIPIDTEHAEELAASLRQGDSLPPIIVTRQSGRRARPFYVWSGNHRVEAHVMTMKTSIAAIEVREVHQDALRALAVAENIGEGLGYSKAQLLSHGVDMVMNGMSRDHAARLCRVSPGELAGAISSRQGLQRVYRLNVMDSHAGVRKAWESIRDSTRRMFVKLDTDVVFVEAIKLTSAAQLTGAMARDFLNEIVAKASGGTGTQIAYINEMRREWSQRIQQVKQGINPDQRKGNPYDVRNALNMGLGHIAIWTPSKLVEGIIRLPVPMREELIKKSEETTQLLRDALDEVNRKLAEN